MTPSIDSRENREFASEVKFLITPQLTYETRLSPDGSPNELVKSLNRIEGVQSVRFKRHDFEGD